MTGKTNAAVGGGTSIPDTFTVAIYNTVDTADVVYIGGDGVEQRATVSYGHVEEVVVKKGTPFAFIMHGDYPIQLESGGWLHVIALTQSKEEYISVVATDELYVTDGTRVAIGWL